MKNKITGVSYSNSTTEQVDSGWWTWNEVCDRCGNQVQRFGDCIASKKPEDNEDLCNDCLRYLIDNKMRFDFVNKVDYTKVKN